MFQIIWPHWQLYEAVLWMSYSRESCPHSFPLNDASGQISHFGKCCVESFVTTSLFFSPPFCQPKRLIRAMQCIAAPSQYSHNHYHTRNAAGCTRCSKTGCVCSLTHGLISPASVCCRGLQDQRESLSGQGAKTSCHI